jgi:hypothetical protein
VEVSHSRDHKVFVSQEGGTDALHSQQQDMYAALALPKPFNISKYILDSIAKQTSASAATQFYQYPIFLQIILDHKYPNLPRAGEQVKFMHFNKRIFAQMRSTKDKGDGNTPQHVDLIGHLMKTMFLWVKVIGWIH